MVLTFIRKKLLGGKVGNAAKTKNAYIVLEDFLRLPVNFYRSLGVDPLEPHRNTSIALHLFFAFQHLALSLALVMQLQFAWINEDFFETMEVLAYWTFGFSGILKAITVQLQKHKMISLVGQLRSCFPSSSEEVQRQYNVKEFLRRFTRFARGYGCLYLALVFTYDIVSFVQYAFQRWVLRLSNPTQSLPFAPLLPWEWRDRWTYYPTYLMQCISGYTATCGHMSSDMMIFAVVMQVIMHFDRLTTALREFEVKNNGQADKADEDLNELRSLIAYHNHILGLTDVMNDIFGIPLLLNFLTSSLLVCNVGFQLTIGITVDHIGQQLLFMSCALVEIYLICSFSQMLIDASENVSFAVYDMNWTETDSRFRKMLLVLCIRAQKPVCLKGTVFLDVSIETMSIFLRLSYKFFCAIQRMYQ